MKKDPKFKDGDYARISKYITIFVKDYSTICSQKSLWLQKLGILYHKHM